MDSKKICIKCELFEVYDKMKLLKDSTKYYLIFNIDNETELSLTKPTFLNDSGKQRDEQWKNRKYIKFYSLDSPKKDFIVVYKRKSIDLDPTFACNGRTYKEWRRAMINYKVYVKMPFDHFVKHNSYYEANLYYEKAAMIIGNDKYNKLHLEDYISITNSSQNWDYGDTDDTDDTDDTNDHQLSDQEYYDKYPSHIDIIIQHSEPKVLRWVTVLPIDKKILCLKAR